MYVFPLSIIILIALTISLKKNGIGSFVSLGVLGAGIYSMPALMGFQNSLATVSSAHRGYVPVPPAADFVVLVSWLALLTGLALAIFVFPRRRFALTHFDDEPVLKSVAWATVAISVLGMIYLAWDSGRILFFAIERKEQNVGIIAVLWRWAPLIGLVAAIQVRQRKLVALNAAILFIIFLRGDRTIVAIATAAAIAIISERNPGWWRRLKPLQVFAFVTGAAVVFLGKSIYLMVKSGLSGHGWSFIDLSVKDQLLFQFEPLATFSHLSYVMTTGITIPPGEFFGSVFGNLLMVPSAFGISTNLYNAVVTETLSPRLGYGIAGNYMAHGYTVAGTAGAAFFYFLLPLILTLCDRQFHNKAGSVKVFWCCVGAVFAFYIHRNGLDNELSFVRQLFIVSFLTAIVAAAIRQFTSTGAPRTWASGVTPAQSRPTEEEFALRGPRPV